MSYIYYFSMNQSGATDHQADAYLRHEHQQLPWQQFGMIRSLEGLQQLLGWWWLTLRLKVIYVLSHVNIKAALYNVACD